MKQKIEKANNKRVEILLLNYANNAISFKVLKFIVYYLLTTK